ncbi:hypothetical protein [Legionella norrlandica]|uniref:hypothetical protein n=1 Tax=Legionella norrlandica TaxID=1498499 RepID=UPI00055F40FC|nr:hypothetical protein [Legionella norrlandica]
MTLIKLLKRGFFSCLIALICLVCALAFFISTTPGLYAVIQLSRFYLPGTLKIHHLKGRLLDQFSAGEIEYQTRHSKIKISNLTVNWRFFSLVQKQLPINNMTADTIEIKPMGASILLIKST